jgi:hypothetical protein
MPTLEIPEATCERLARRAAALSTSVESLAVPALEEVACEEIPAIIPSTPGQPVDLPYDEWKKVFDEIVAHAGLPEDFADRILWIP